MAETLTTHPEGIKRTVRESGWVEEEVLAAGQLRQGRAPTTLAMVTGVALFEVLRPRRSKLLPRHFVMVLTPERAVAFRASGGSPESGAGSYELRIRPGEAASFPRASVRISDLPDGPRSKGGIMSIGTERFPVARPNLNGDSNTDELIDLLRG
jgi:hypothetical protein